MKITAELTRQEWLQEREMLAAHLSEWLSHEPPLAKGAQPDLTPRAHPMKAVDQMTSRLSEAYQTVLAGMNDAILEYLSSQIGQEPH